MKFKIPITLTFLTLFFLGCIGSDDECPPDTNCSDYNYQISAQIAFDRNPECKGDLDADNDGIACEDWETYYQSLNGPSSNPSNPNNGGCPNTAACGCSNKNKSACQSSSCCKWTVGEGCGCK